MYLTPREKRNRKTKLLFYRIFLTWQVISMFIGASYFWYNKYRNNDWNIIKSIGAVIAIPSYILWSIARFQLGLSFSILPSANNLVTTGLYSVVRHPIYFFSGLSILGYILLVGEYLWLYGFVILIPIQLYRAYLEDVLLSKSFGRDYAVYAYKVTV